MGCSAYRQAGGMESLRKVEQIARIAHGSFFRMRHFFEGGELRLQIAAFEVDKGAEVAHLVAVVGRREDRDALSIVSLRRKNSE